MSIRIQDNYQADAAAKAGRMDEISRPPASSKAKSSSGPAAASDEVDISSLSGKIADAVATQQTQQSERVSHLAALYANGNYHVDANTLSKALVSQAIGASSGESTD